MVLFDIRHIDGVGCALRSNLRFHRPITDKERLCAHHISFRHRFARPQLPFASDSAHSPWRHLPRAQEQAPTARPNQHPPRPPLQPRQLNPRRLRAPLTTSVIGTTNSPLATTPVTAEVTPAAAPAIMPNVVCMNLQDAQDTIQSAGVFFSRSADATGAGRRQLVDSNWIVVDQTPSAGSPFGEIEAVLSAVKIGEPNPC